MAGKELMKIALPAQLIYMTLFSYSFFFDGISGLCIAISSVATLAVLMKATARTDWESVFKLRKKRRTPPSDGPEDDPDPDDPKRPTPPPMQHSPA